MPSMLRGLAALPMVAAIAQDKTTVEIAKDVFMPLLNLGNYDLSSNSSLFLEVGGHGIDTALSYGDKSLQEAGDAVRHSMLPRDQIFLTSKIPCGRDSLGSPTEDIEHSFKVLGVDYVDLLLMHWPCTSSSETEKVWKAMEPLVAQGKARAIGISNFRSSQIKKLLGYATIKPAVNQCEFSIGNHDDDTWQTCKDEGITYAAYSPLGGLENPFDIQHSKDVLDVAATHNKSWAQVALRWVVQEGVVAVSSTTKESHMRGDLEIFDFELSDEEMQRLHNTHKSSMVV